MEFSKYHKDPADKCRSIRDLGEKGGGCSFKACLRPGTLSCISLSDKKATLGAADPLLCSFADLKTYRVCARSMECTCALASLSFQATWACRTQLGTATECSVER